MVPAIAATAPAIAATAPAIAPTVPAKAARLLFNVFAKGLSLKAA
jgi:hypothetical protein